MSRRKAYWLGTFLSRRTPVRAHRSKGLFGISGWARAGGPRTAASLSLASGISKHGVTP